MKRLLCYLFCFLYVCASSAQGIPYIKKFTANEYHGHSINFDVITGEDGYVYVANFEGLLYYNNVDWKILHTPGNTRVTVSFRDKQGTIWIGGYNYFGKVISKPNGELALKEFGSSALFRGEVIEIWDDDDDGVNFLVNNGVLYCVKDDKISIKKRLSDNKLTIGLTDVLDVKRLEQNDQAKAATDTLVKESLDNGLTAIVRKGHGLIIADDQNRIHYTINETNGLKSNNINYISYDGHGTLWAVMSDEIYAINVPSAFSHFSKYEGLSNVQSAAAFNGKIYAGTTDGLFRLEGRRFVKTDISTYACTMLQPSSHGLLVATSIGIFRINRDGMIKQLTNSTSLAVTEIGGIIYSGELNGVFAIDPVTNSKKIVCKMEKASKIIQDKKGNIWLQSVYGEIWCKKVQDNGFKPYRKDKEEKSYSLAELKDSVAVIGSEETSPFPYPLFSYLDDDITWLTDNSGKHLYRWKDNHQLEDLNYLYPFNEISVTAMIKRNQEIWLGHKDGFTVIDMDAKDPAFQTKPRLMIRSATLGNDSVLWGGFGSMPEKLPLLDSRNRHLHFTYSLDYAPIVGQNLYRYRLNNGNWSSWSEKQDVAFLNLSYGDYTLSIQGRDGFGHNTEITSIQFTIDYPLYLKWYVILLYIILFVCFLYLLVRLRLRSLKNEKIRLEKMVQERTVEIVKQKDEIQEKSESLEKALKDLHQAQNKLIRQEKMATVGKLTQGLIDRILNPLNYINNFSKLSEELVKDVEANIEDEKDNISEDNYEDTIEVLGMLKGNLQKVGEHGQNTTRTLKAMEEMLKDRTSGIVKMDIVQLFQQNEEMVHNYYAEQIKQQHVRILFEYPDEPIFIKGNPELLSKVFMSMLANSMYAVAKKGKQKDYQPEVSLKATVADSEMTIIVHDDGIGIEETIINKIFDPFFTTKTTGEASGIGLYLTHDIIQNYGGNITVESVKDEYTTFRIVLPIIK